jgi:cytochrome P450
MPPENCNAPAVSQSFYTVVCTRGTMAAMTTQTLSTTLPPGPAGRWLGFDHLGAMRRDYLGFVQALQRDYGDMVHMRIVNENCYDLLHPDLVREALVDNAEHLIRWERGIEVFAQTFGQSVLVTEGETWKRQRRMLMPAFTPKRVAGYAALMREAAAVALDAALPAGVNEGEVGMDDLFSRLAMDVILRTLFGHRADARETQAAIDATHTMSETAFREMFRPFTLPDWLPLPGKAAKRHALRTLRGLIAQHIAQRKAEPGDGGEDLLSRLLALRDEETGEALSDTEIFDQCMVSFQAGHETSATALLWWSRLVAQHQEVAERIHAELDRVLAGRAPGPEDLPALEWLGASLKEAMRLYPPIAAVLSRRVMQDMQLGGWNIPRGAMLRITPWVLHHDARWFDAPHAFRPERFLPDAPPIHRGAYMPFGAGPRVCLGQHFAVLEMTLAAAMLLQRYRLALPAGAAACEPELHVTLRPRGGVQLRLSRHPVSP